MQWRPLSHGLCFLKGVGRVKRIVTLLVACFVCLTLTVPCLAAEFENPPIVDGAGYLSASENAELTERLQAIRQAYHFDVAIVTEYEMSGYDAQSSADDIYDYGGYGAGENDDGILLYICAATREYYLTTHADGMRIFNEAGIDYLKMNIQPYLEEDAYYSAMQTFATLAEELLVTAANGEPFSDLPNTPEYVLAVIGAALLLPLIIAFFMMLAKLAKMKTAVENNYAANYMKPGSKTLNVSRDIFLYSTVIKTKRPKSNSGGVHRSSSGRTHGGGGGSF